MRPDERVKQIRALLAQNQKGLAVSLGRAMGYERFCRVVTTRVQTTPALLKCDPGSILVSAFRIAQLQLSPDPALGQAWIIPRKGRAEFQLGYLVL